MVKRLLSILDVAEQAHRGLDPLTGRILSEETAIDPRLLPRLDWPISPVLQQAISSVVSDAIAANVSLTDACERIMNVLNGHGIDLSRDDLGALVTSHSLGVS